MSVLANNTTVRVDTTHREDERLTLRWTVSRRALASVRPDLAAPEPGVVLIEWVIPRRPEPAVAILIDPESGRRVELLTARAESVWTDDPAVGIEHVDIAGLLAASFRHGNGCPPRILYARTPLIEQLHIAGGRYELAGMTLDAPD
jgi:hypothetical protein